MTLARAELLIIRLTIPLCFPITTKSTLNTIADQNNYFAVDISMWLFLWYNMANLHLSWPLRIPLNIINGVIFVLCSFVWVMSDEIGVDDLIQQFNEDRYQVIASFIMVVGVIEVFNFTLKN